MKLQHALIIGLLLITSSTTVSAKIPTQGINAEVEGRHHDAIRIYRNAIKHSSKDEQIQLWLRIADIEYARGNADASAEATKNAAELAKTDPELYERLSTSYSTADKPEEALEALEKAYTIKPVSFEYHKKRAQLASWAGNYEAAEESHKAILEANPREIDSILWLARIHSWQGNLDKASLYFAEYLELRPTDADAMLSYAYNESWRGDYAKALDILKQYRTLKGETRAFEDAKSRFLARAARTRAALAATDTVLRRHPRDYNNRYSKTVALNNARRHKQALVALDQVAEVSEQDKVLYDLRRVTFTPIRPRVAAGMSYATDSDTVDIYNLTLNGVYPYDPETFLRAGVRYSSLRAERPSGLNDVNGDDRVDYVSTWVGFELKLDPRIDAIKEDLWVNGRIGYSENTSAEDALLYDIGFTYHPSDDLRFILRSSQDFYAVSPRALSLDIELIHNTFQATWSPDMIHVVEGLLEYGYLSDSNSFWQFTFAPRRQWIRNQHMNVDVGLALKWLSFHDKKGNGYYDPEYYQQYLITFQGYYKLSDDDGISFTIAPGIQKDDEMDKFRFSGNLSVEGIFGLYKDWMLRVYASAIRNIGILDNAYDRHEVGMEVTKRF